MASSSSAQLRLMSDLKSIINEPPEGCSASPLSDENLFVWSATIFGPDETPWEGGVFSLRMTFGQNYPEKPPRVRFTSEMFHPNIYRDGTLCMDIIQDAWSPCHNVSTILTSVQQILRQLNSTSKISRLITREYVAVPVNPLIRNIRSSVSFLSTFWKQLWCVIGRVSFCFPVYNISSCKYSVRA
ncbi:ubiquitin-conjugating enzyme E2 1-like isoform X1 [Carica papaya]|uniref:ubiquitin-conjugating enzyme E2 1-like isoform X1 n=1 Tax=Carica papaya TaxID=3649 RepID=UPI000B8C7DE8|nr:ubiquitin-conjugating enzyme E2 1-like isoform X1 [Carica papaya]